MRCANRNKQPFWYALYAETDEYLNDDGNQIGTYPIYGKPVKAYGNISAAKGAVITRQFGDDDEYSRVIVLEDRDTPINEDAVIWIDATPELNEDGSLVFDDETGLYATPWNYTVSRVARGLPEFGCTQIAVNKVTVS